MDAQYIKLPITVLGLDNEERYGIAELLMLNSVVEVGAVPIERLLNSLANLVQDPWQAVQEAVTKTNGIVEICGTQSGIVIRVTPRWRGFMRVGREFVPSRNSDKHVALYRYLKQHGDASNANLRGVLKHASASQTSSFLRHAKYVRRTGSGLSARWSLVG